MARRFLIAALVLSAALLAPGVGSTDVQASGRGQPTDWQRFYYYPYIYYPHNFRRFYGSYDSLYYRYPWDRRIPVYRKDWYNFYPTERPYHAGHHFILDAI
ncbi:MAG: hypothetical protein ACREJB_11130 [Planctomycetaceae bacterium]